MHISNASIKGFDFSKWLTSFVSHFILQIKIRFIGDNFLLEKIEQNFMSVFTFVQKGVRMKLLKDMRSEENEHCKVN